ncbi:hypothetical protein LINPERPRIM_LOCUS6908 [Linum perenne]
MKKEIVVELEDGECAVIAIEVPELRSDDDDIDNVVPENEEVVVGSSVQRGNATFGDLFIPNKLVSPKDQESLHLGFEVFFWFLDLEKDSKDADSGQRSYKY